MATRTISDAGGNYNAVGAWVEGAVPTSADDVAATATSGQLTINVASACRSMNLTNYVSTLTHNSSITLSIGDATAGASNVALTMVAGMTYTLGSVTTSAISFISTSATVQTVASGGKTLGNITFNGVGGAWAMTSGITIGATATITLTNGALQTDGTADTSALTHSWGRFDFNNSNLRTLTLGTSNITITGSTTIAWDASSIGNLTFSGASSVITLTGATSGFRHGVSPTYNNVTFQGTTNSIRNGVSAGTYTFANLTMTGNAVKNATFTLNRDVIITGTLTVNGNSSTDRVLVQSNTLGAARTITAATVTITNADFSDITGTGAGSWDLSAITGLSGDAGGNSGITFTTAVPQFWIGDTGSWSDSTQWSITSGGAANGRVPLPQDDVNFDNGSFSGASQVVTLDMPRAGRNIDWSAYSESHSPAPSWNKNLSTTVYGSITLKSGLANTGNPTFSMKGRGAFTLTTAGQTWSNATSIEMIGGTLTLQDAFDSALGLTLLNGTLDANNFNLTATTFVSTGSLTRAITMGSGTWTVTSTGTVWNVAATLTVTPGTSTIVLSNTTATAKTFAGQSKTYNNITFSGDNITVTGSNTFNTFRVENAGLATGLKITSGTTQTVSAFTTNGSSGNLAILSSVTAGSAHTFTTAASQISVDFMSIKDSTVIQTDVWYAGTGSTDVSGNTNWIFTAPPAVGGVNSGFFQFM